MKFVGDTPAQRGRSGEAWEGWLQSVGPKSRKARFARRLVREIESRVRRPNPHVAQVAADAVATATRVTLKERGLTKEEFQEVVQALLASWHHGHSFRIWASRNGHI